MNKEKILAKGKSASSKVIRFVASRAFYLVLGVFLATAAVALAATSWNGNADRGGGPALTGPMWDGLIDNLKNNSGPGNWTCATRSAARNGIAFAECAGKEKVISGGCVNTSSNWVGFDGIPWEAFTATSPSVRVPGWRCHHPVDSVNGPVSAYAYCCL